MGWDGIQRHDSTLYFRLWCWRRFRINRRRCKPLWGYDREWVLLALRGFAKWAATFDTKQGSQCMRRDMT